MRKQIKFTLLNLILSIAGLAAPELARGQYVGTVSLQTIQQTLANTVTCTGNPQVFVTVNLGQTQHLLTAASNAPSFLMEIDGIDKLSNVFKISNPMITVTSSTYLIQGNGYLPIIEASVTCTAASTFSLSYSGSFTGNQIASVSAPGSTTGSSSTGSNVQGMVATTVNAQSIFPIVSGALQPAVNAKFASFGLDNFSASSKTEAGGFTGNFTIANPPTPSQPGEAAIAFINILGTIGGGTGIQAPWSCVVPSCGATNPTPIAIVSNVTTATALVTNQINSNPGNANVVFLEFATTPTVRQQQFANNITPGTPGNTLAGSTLVAAFFCNSFPCQIDSVSDTQGNKWSQVTSLQNPNAAQPAGISVWMTGPSSAAAEAATGVAHSGTTVNSSGILELTGGSPANLNEPSLPLFSSNNKASGTNENDNGGLFTEAGGFSLSQTVTISAAGTTVFPLWDVTQHGAFSSCVLTQRVTNIAGAGTTLNTYLQDSADLVGWNDRLSMVQSTTAGGANNQLGAVAGGTGITPAATTDGALAAGSKLDGPLGPFGRIKFVTVGAATSVTITYNVVCR